MRIAYFSNLRGVDGTKTNADRLCAEFDRREEIDLTAVHIQGTGLPENLHTTEPGYETLYPMSFRDGIEATDPDIVFIHGYNVEMIEYLEEFVDEEDEEDEDRAYVFRNGVNVMENWLALYSNPDPRMVTTPLQSFDLFDGIFAPSMAAAERLDFIYGPACPSIAIAPCVIDYDHYAPTPWMDGDTLTVVTASRLAPNNYIIAPLLAVRRFAQERDDIDVELHILGGGDKPYWEVISQLAGDMDEVNATGHIDPDEVRQYLQEADIACVPSVTQQAVPTVAVEALAAGCVVLSGAYQTAAEEEALVQVPVDHPVTWFDALADVVDSPEDATEQIRTGLEAARAYDVERVVNQAYMPMLTMLFAEYA